MKTPAVVLALATLVAGPVLSAQTLALSRGAVLTRPAVVPALDDATIVAIFDAANSWDIETSQLAVKQATTKDARDFATMMINDHTAVRQLGRDLATKLKVVPTPPGKDFPLAVDHDAIMKTLRGAKGAAFDKAYIDHEVWYHQAVIDAITTQLLPATKNAELKALETKVAPNFQAHLLAAKAAQKQIEK